MTSARFKKKEKRGNERWKENTEIDKYKKEIFTKESEKDNK